MPDRTESGFETLGLGPSATKSSRAFILAGFLIPSVAAVHFAWEYLETFDRWYLFALAERADGAGVYAPRSETSYTRRVWWPGAVPRLLSEQHGVVPAGLLAPSNYPPIRCDGPPGIRLQYSLTSRGGRWNRGPTFSTAGGQEAPELIECLENAYSS